MTLTHEQGSDIVRYARQVIEGHFSRRKPKVPDTLEALFQENRGVFVTLKTVGGDLRGCIGYPEPTHTLGEAVEGSAKSAALEDPRFPRVEASEMDNLLVEVSVLTKPELVTVQDPRDYRKKIVVGRDGLIAELGWSRGLLLPQVPVEWKWDAGEFIKHTCDKAGLPATAYLTKGFKLYSFTAQVFSEESPRGKAVEEKLN